MIAQNFVHAALLAGHSALFITATQMLLDCTASPLPENEDGFEMDLLLSC